MQGGPAQITSEQGSFENQAFLFMGTFFFKFTRQGAQHQVYEHVYLFLLSLVLTMADPRVSISISAAPSLSWILTKRKEPLISSVKGSVLTYMGRNRGEQRSLHSTVQGAERIAFGLVKNLLFQQNLHTRIVTYRKECRKHQLYQPSSLSAHNRGSLKHFSLSKCQNLNFRA